MVWLGSLLRVSPGWNQDIVLAAFPLEAPWKNLLLAPSYSWLNSVPCGCRTEVSVSLLSVSWGWLSALSLPAFLGTWPSPSSKSAMACGVLLKFWIFLTTLPLTSRPRPKGLLWLSHSYPDNLLNLKKIDLWPNYLCKIPPLQHLD